VWYRPGSREVIKKGRVEVIKKDIRSEVRARWNGWVLTNESSRHKIQP
jgi:hypothetical protein